jgi:Eukaryotic aspartyl protease
MSLKFKPLAFFIVCLLFSLYISQTTCIPHKPTNQVPIALVSGEGESEREVRFQRRGPMEMSKVRKVGHLLKQHHQRLEAAALNKEARAPVELSKSDLVSMSITSRAMASFIENLMEEIDPADEDVSLEVDMINVFNTFYITPATISGTEINFIMDTGSSGIVTNSDLCKTFGCVNNAAVETQTKIYWEQGGECAISLDEHWDIVYGSGTVECRLGEALVDVGGMQIPKQSLCLIENEEGILYKVSQLDLLIIFLGLLLPRHFRTLLQFRRRNPDLFGKRHAALRPPEKNFHHVHAQRSRRSRTHDSRLCQTRAILWRHSLSRCDNEALLDPQTGWDSAQWYRYGILS